MGLMNWLMKGAGFEVENDDGYDEQEAKKLDYEEKMRKKDEKKIKKLERKNMKKQQKADRNIPEYEPNILIDNDNQLNSNYSSGYDRTQSSFGVNSTNSSNVGGFGTKNVEFVNPTRYEDVVVIISYLREGESVMLKLGKMNGNDSQRLLDCVAGAVYALNGNLKKVETDIYLITPEGFNIKVSKDNEVKK